MAKEVEYSHNITCPECGHEDQDSWEAGDDGEVDCDCGCTYFYERHVTVDYSTKTLKTKEENEIEDRAKQTNNSTSPSEEPTHD